MQLAVTFRNIDATDALREYAEEKVQRIRKFLRRPIEAHVVLAVNKHRHMAEITVTANRMAINATEETGDLYSAIDLAVSKIERQIKTQMSKRQSRKHAAAAAASPASEKRPTIRSERVVVRPMSVREAARELAASSSEFLLFQNVTNELLCVMYRRKNGSYGLIEPEVG